MVMYRMGTEPSSGRYWAVCRRKGRWYEFLDEAVVPVSEEEWRDTEVCNYMLFYCARELME